MEPEPALEGMPEPEAEADENVSSSMDSATIMERSLQTQIPPPSEEEKLGAAVGPTGEALLDIAPDTTNELRDEQIRPVLNIRSFVRYIEVALLVIAITTGIAAFILFRRTRMQ